MANARRGWTSTRISNIASRTFFFLIFLQIPLFRIPCRSGICITPMHVTCSQLVASDIIPVGFVKTLIFPGALVQGLVQSRTIPSWSSLENIYNLTSAKDAPVVADLKRLEAKNRRVAILTDPSSEKPVRVARCFLDMPNKSAENILVHGAPLLPNHRKDGHENLQLPVPVRDDLTILADAVEGFVQWPSNHIYLGTKKTDKPESKDIPTTASSLKEQVEGKKIHTDKVDHPIDNNPTTTSLKDQVDEDIGTSNTKANSHYFPQLKDVRSLSSTDYSGNVYMQNVRTVTMRDLYKEADLRIASEQLIIILLEEDILGKECEVVLSWDLLTIWP